MEISISNPVSKNDVYEEMSLVRASLEDAASRSGSGQEPQAISNEQIVMGDTLLETYRVVSDAINGGMSNVWKVHHESWDTDLAMKRPQPRYFAEGSRQRKEAFLRECENWIDLGLHPNIVSCYYVREIGGVPTVFSEWMDGGSLRDRMHDRTLYKGEGAAVQERILSIAIQTARGLAYSHARGLNHQDVKPGNLLLSKDWDAKISDFGLAMAGAVEEPKRDASVRCYRVSMTNYPRGRFSKRRQRTVPCLLPYFSVIVAPSSLSFAFRVSASSMETPSLIIFGADSTNSFASFRHNPMTSRMTFMTLTFCLP